MMRKTGFQVIVLTVLLLSVATGTKETTIDARTGSAAGDNEEEDFWEQFRKPKVRNAQPLDGDDDGGDDDGASEAPPRISPIKEEDYDNVPYEHGGFLVMNDATGRRVAMKKQRNDGNDVEVPGTRAVIDKSVAYLRDTILGDEGFADVYTNCDNRHELCSFWAFSGQCEKNVNYMLRDHYCLLACQRCDKLLE